MSGHPTGLEMLDEIKAAQPKQRFLQSWDRVNRVLRYACGDNDRAVFVGSDGSVEPGDSSQPTKLQPETVRTFIDGAAPAENPFMAVRAVLKDYVYFGDDRMYTLLAAWITGTYVYSIFSHYGYLFLHSLMPRCGKTRAEEVTSHLAFEATQPRNAPTPPSMRETVVAGGTAIFDTLERWKEKGSESYGAAMELLDAGFRNGGEVSKMVRNSDGEWRQELYTVYAPYMVAAIDQRSLTDTALDRSFEVAMTRKSTRHRTIPYDARCELRCRPIREQLYVSALTNASRIADAYESQELQQRVDALGLNDRAADIWKPLFAVTSVMAEDATNDLATLAVEMSPDPDRQEERRQLGIISALRTLAGPDEGVVTGTTQQIIAQLQAVTSVDAPDLHGILSEWGFSEKSIRLDGIETPRKAWEITDAEFATVEARLKG